MKYTIVFPRVRDSSTPYAYAVLGRTTVYMPDGRVKPGLQFVALNENQECVPDTAGSNTMVVIGPLPQHFDYAPDPDAVPDGIKVRFGFNTDGSLPKAELDIDDHEYAVVVHGKTVSELVARVALILRALREENTHDY